jgi:glycosyltransferase involved in cell wall biosynthesis
VHNYYLWHKQNLGLFREVTAICSEIVYVSSAVRQYHEQTFEAPASKGRVINNPINLEGLIIPDKAQLRRLRRRSDETVFLNVAQMYPAKAQVALITAFARASRERKDIRLMIAGAPVDRTVERNIRMRIAEEGVQDKVELLGFCDRRRMSVLYAKAHAFALPSIYEGYSVSSIEAASFGLPLIMTDVGGASDLIENGGCGILLPGTVPKLEDVAASDIEQLGVLVENGATKALELSFLEMARNRNRWIDDGLTAMFDIRTMNQACADYIDVISKASAMQRT